MSAIKASLTTAITTISPSTVVIDPWRMKTFQFNAFEGSLVSIKINPSKFSRLSYGSQIVNKHFGQYHIYHFTMNVISRYVYDDELRAKTAMNLANSIVTYLRTHNKDASAGILDIWNVTARESDPRSVHMARIIVDGFVLCERPIGNV
jgi:hypothetical protein